MESKKCPICGRLYTDHPAISRKDNKTEICPSCGAMEAMKQFLDYINQERQEVHDDFITEKKED